MQTRLQAIPRRRLSVLAVLAIINLVNYADRLVLPPLFPLLREHFQLSSAQLGSLQTILQIVLAVATIPFGLLADRISRPKIIAAGVIFWSLATFLTGIAQTFLLLLVARALVGVGEAAYAPAAQSMISGAFSEQSRARAQAIFAAGMLLGGTAGTALGGVIGEALGWRPAFFLIGVPGLFLALFAYRLQDPPRGPRAEVVPLSHLLRVPAFVTMIVGGAFITFASLAFITWGTDFVVRYKDFTLREAGISLGTTLVVSSLLGVLTGGTMADILQKRFAFGRILTVATAFLVAAPFLIWAITTEEKGYVVTAFFIAGYFMSWYHGPVTAVIHDMMPRRAHATSVGVYMFVTQLLGGIFGPLVVGKIDDVSSLVLGLKVAVAVMMAGACILLLVIFFIRRDGLRHPILDPYRHALDD